MNDEVKANISISKLKNGDIIIKSVGKLEDIQNIFSECFNATFQRKMEESSYKGECKIENQ
jgi:hypothetical protein